MRRIIHYATLSVTLAAAGCLGAQFSPQSSPSVAAAPSASLQGGTVTTRAGSTDGGAAPSAGATPSATAELVKFGSCMAQADWTSSGMDKLADQVAGDSGPCRGCHQAGAFSVYLSSDPTQNYQHMKSLPFLYRFAALEVNPDGSFKDIVASDGFSQRSNSITLDHPPFTLSSDVQTALDKYFQLTYARYKSGNCQ